MQIELDKNKSDINLKEYDKKLYVDPQYGGEHYSSIINYAVFTNRWNIEDDKEEYGVKIIHPASGDSILLSFNTFKDKLAFVQNIYSSHYIKQISTGHDLESLANLNLLYAEKKSREENIIITLFEFLRSITAERILPKISTERGIKRIISVFKKGQFAN